jgi:hypothetical protein
MEVKTLFELSAKSAIEIIFLSRQTLGLLPGCLLAKQYEYFRASFIYVVIWSEFRYLTSLDYPAAIFQAAMTFSSLSPSSSALRE